MLHFQATHGADTSTFFHGRGPLVLGRDPEARDPYRELPKRALPADAYMSRDHLIVEEIPGARVRLTNLSVKAPIRLTSGGEIGPRASAEVDLPIRLRVGETFLEVKLAGAEGLELDSLLTLARPFRGGEGPGLSRLEANGKAVDVDRLTRWFEAVVAIQRASTSSNAFYQETARAVVDQVGLDRGLVLLRKGEGWQVAARHEAEPAPGPGPEYSQLVVERVCRERLTFYTDPAAGQADSNSLAGVQSVVAAPVFAGGDDRVDGIVYGARFVRPGGSSAAIQALEAQLVQVLACAVGAGLARVESDAVAARQRVQFEQFFSAELARELERDPGLLEGREREVTVLFCDMRGFSTLSEKLSPREVCEFAQDFMDQLTARVLEFAGTVVTFRGDGIMALWNAPAEQPDHAALACRAALAMRAALPELDRRWAERTGRPLALGIGINTGLSLVGNTGSRARFMYGPQGHTVNLASRVEGATKAFGVPILITGPTRALLGDAFATRRLCRARVAGIEQPVELHELRGEGADLAWTELRAVYEEGLANYEAGRWTDACHSFVKLIAAGDATWDPPSLLLVGRCIEYVRDPRRPFDPVVDLDRK